MNIFSSLMFNRKSSTNSLFYVYIISFLFINKDKYYSSINTTIMGIFCVLQLFIFYFKYIKVMSIKEINEKIRLVCSPIRSNNWE
jgi:uncharacterized membrane protein YobD (UPF0266 family)